MTVDQINETLKNITELLGTLILAWSVFRNGRKAEHIDKKVDHLAVTVNGMSAKREVSAYDTGARDQAAGEYVSPKPGVPE